MLYIQQSLTDGEDLVHVAQFHWMYNVQAVFNIVFSIVLSVAIIVFAVRFHPVVFHDPGYPYLSWIEKVRVLHPGIKIAAFFVMLMGILRFVQMMIVRVTTEIVVTNKRLVYKRGLIARYVGEINIDRIEGVNVLQGVLGRIFGYGRLMVRGMGVGEVMLPAVDAPITFRKAIDRARGEWGREFQDARERDARDRID